MGRAPAKKGPLVQLLALCTRTGRCTPRRGLPRSWDGRRVRARPLRRMSCPVALVRAFVIANRALSRVEEISTTTAGSCRRQQSVGGRPEPTRCPRWGHSQSLPGLQRDMSRGVAPALPAPRMRRRHLVLRARAHCREAFPWVCTPLLAVGLLITQKRGRRPPNARRAPRRQLGGRVHSSKVHDFSRAIVVRNAHQRRPAPNVRGRLPGARAGNLCTGRLRVAPESRFRATWLPPP